MFFELKLKLKVKIISLGDLQKKLGGVSKEDLTRALLRSVDQLMKAVFTSTKGHVKNHLENYPSNSFLFVRINTFTNKLGTTSYKVPFMYLALVCVSTPPGINLHTTGGREMMNIWPPVA